MNYEEMSVHDLLCEASDPDAYLDEIESALRKAVIRDASVGTLVHACDFPDMSVTYMKDDGDLLVGDYWLIPKETS